MCKRVDQTNKFKALLLENKLKLWQFNSIKWQLPSKMQWRVTISSLLKKDSSHSLQTGLRERWVEFKNWELIIHLKFIWMKCPSYKMVFFPSYMMLKQLSSSTRENNRRMEGAIAQAEHSWKFIIAGKVRDRYKTLRFYFRNFTVLFNINKAWLQ